jgi:D-alanyl-D-alanine carboxypeptidase
MVVAVVWLSVSPAIGGPPAQVAVLESGGPTGSVASETATAAASTAPSPTPTWSPTPSVRPSSSPKPGSVEPGDSFPIGAAQGIRPMRPTASVGMRAELDRALRTLRTKLGSPGVSAAIVFADGSTWLGTDGFADVAAARLVTPDTPFAAASISKTFTAALILSLADEGKLRLDAPALTYLPDLAIDGRITIRELLDHTSGLADFYLGKGVDKALLADRAKTWTAADALAFVGKPHFPPGTAYSYSNTNYLVLGLVAEAVGGAPVATQLRARFLDPLGPTDTTYQAIEPPAGLPAHAYRFAGASLALKPIDLSDGSSITPFTSVVTAGGAAASIATTPRDLVRWARALYGGSVLGQAGTQTMLADVARTRKYHVRTAPYGLGVQSFAINGQPTLGHSGRLLGSMAAVRWLPGQSIAIAVMTNQSRADPAVIVKQLLAIALVPPPDCGDCPAGW